MVSSPKEDVVSWEGVTLEAARVLVDLLTETTAADKGLLQRRFAERARGFNETLKYLERMQALKLEGQYIYPDQGLEPMKEALRTGKQEFMKYLTRLGTASTTGYGREIRKVCHAFRLEGGQAQMRSEGLGREHYAARNILLEAGAIRLHHETGICTINAWFHRDFIRTLYTHGTTPQELDDLMRDRSDIGFAAELEVLKSERRIVGERDASNVIHVALENTSAGFDIASIRRQQNPDQLTVRLIEVKAVSPRDWKFIFTRNEVRVATEHQSAYFLYLVPVVKGLPDVDQAYVLENPVENLLNADEWCIKQGDWNVRRRVHHA